MTHRPLVSIITPTFNRARYIGETIRSVLAQTYTHFEMLIVDNGSTDNTREIVESFRDPRICYFYQENSGSPVSPRNKGFVEARGEIICFLDSDDLWLPHKLASQVAELQSKPTVGLTYADCYLINDQDCLGGRYSNYHKPYQGMVLANLLRTNFIPALTVAFRKEQLSRYGDLNGNYLISHDIDLYLKISNDYPISYISEPLAKLRVHPTSLSQNRIQGRLEFLDVVKPWCQGTLRNKVPLGTRKHIWGMHCFRMGLEILSEENADFAQARFWFRQAIQSYPIHLLYYGAYFLSILPFHFIPKGLKKMKKRRSVQFAFQNRSL